MSDRKKQSILNGAMVLSFAIIVVKLIGFFFKIFVSNKIGTIGVSYYSTAYGIYTPIYSISLAGLPVAVAKIVAQKAAMGKYRDVRKLFRVSTRMFILLGLVGTSVILLIAYPYVKSVNTMNALPAIIALTPSLFFCCVMSSYRGYYQGLRNMNPSAASQIVESGGKLLFGWIFVQAVMLGTVSFADKIPIIRNYVTDDVGAYAAAGAIAGVTLGSGIALVWLIFYKGFKGDGITKEELAASPKAESGKNLARQLIAIAIPVALSSLIFNVSTFIDSWTVQFCLNRVLINHPEKLYEMYADIVQKMQFADITDFKNYLYGAYELVMEVKNLVPAFTVTLGMSAIPVMSEAFLVKDKRALRSSANSVLRLSLMLALPAGFGMAALSDDILGLLYGRNAGNILAIPVVSGLLAIYGLTITFLALSQPSTNMLHAVNKMNVPIYAMGAGAVVKIVLNMTLVSIPTVNIKGAVYGSVACYMVIVFINLAALIKEMGARPDFKTVLVKPLISAVFSGCAAWAVNGICERLFDGVYINSYLTGENISCVIGMLAAVFVYTISLLVTHTLVKDDVIMLPKGEKIAKVLAKYDLLG